MQVDMRRSQLSNLIVRYNVYDCLKINMRVCTSNVHMVAEGREMVIDSVTEKLILNH